MKFLLIDDHQILRDGLRRILLAEFPGAVIEEVSNAEDVVEKVTRLDFDLILCDLSMPGRGGIDVVKQVKETHPKLPVIILSMLPDENYAMRALKAGAMGYVNKTSGTAELLQAIHRVLQGRKYISPTVVEQLTEDINSKAEQTHDELSDREFEVFKLIAEGKGISEIANQLSLSLSTVSTHRSRILAKMKMKGNADIVKHALQHNLL